MSSSGAGEMLAKVQLPFHIAKRAGRKDCLGMVDAVLTVIKQEFIGRFIFHFVEFYQFYQCFIPIFCYRKRHIKMSQ